MPGPNPTAQFDLTGQVFGRLTVLSRSVTRKYHWLCRCDCGEIREVSGSNLRNGNTQSCGCLHRMVASITTGQANLTHGQAYSRTYASWQAMLTRCENPNAANYALYGGSGVLVCERWHSFENFLADMGERPPGTSLDRYPNRNGNYEPGNCRWATPKEQRRNEDPLRLVTFRGETKCVAAWEQDLGFPRGTIWKRLFRKDRAGWSIEKAMLTPVKE